MFRRFRKGLLMADIDGKKINRYRELIEQKERLESLGEYVSPKIADEMSWIKSQCTPAELRELTRLRQPASS